ncbi:VanZ family protein [Cellvibrio sp. OA-2007]|uniref:VanZ family protein n=1 Tax=Cellvibrio sp. OA-2007 TaxID=529823 RepID=UPI001EE733F3|nr:VanZ family protein [Cellvibrio sp. OA-2007]
MSLPAWLSGLCVLVLVPFFFVGGPDASSSVLLKNAWNFGHIIFFSLLLLLVQSFKPLVSWKQWLVVTIIAIAIGAGIEFVQSFVGRNASVDDVLHNVFGVWLGLFWGQKASRFIWCLRVVSCLLIAPAAWLVIDSAVAHATLRYQFPLLNGFESRQELQQLQANTAQVITQPTHTLHTQGVQAVQITLGTLPYAGVALTGNYGDWSPYRILAMDFYNPEVESLELVIKISDYAHDRGDNNFNDRFNRRIMLLQGWNQVQIELQEVRSAPRQRVMQMDQISGITIFAAGLGLPRARVFYIDNVKLQ